MCVCVCVCENLPHVLKDTQTGRYSNSRPSGTSCRLQAEVEALVLLIWRRSRGEKSCGLSTHEGVREEFVIYLLDIQRLTLTKLFSFLYEVKFSLVSFRSPAKIQPSQFL